MVTVIMFRLILLLQLVILLYATTPGPLFQKCNPQDKKALLQIKKDLNYPNSLSSWNPYTDCCHETQPWKGVMCDSTQGNRVNYLSLSDLDLHAHPLEMPFAIGNLPFLNFLYINRIPNLTGPFPTTIANLTKLRYLTIRNTLLSGPIPKSLGKLNLAFVDLSRNRLDGDASMLFGSKKQTQKINLSRNRVAFDLGKVRLSKNLEALDLRNNGIYGRLPRRLTALKSLRELNLSYNSLSGEIPKGGNLQSFDVSSYVHNKGLCGSPLRSCTRFLRPI
ncbi:Leucine-rich repeat [Sesbania bispinosa]|nr:Leucine-rich repeat [Sesbania bispinosa]